MKTKRNRPFTFYAVIHESSVFPYSGKKRLSWSSLSITLCNGATIREYEADLHMNFSLINGVASVKIIFVVILSFEVALMNSPIL